MANEQVRSLAQELVDFISGEPKRFEQEQAARTRGAHQDENVRKSRLVDEVSKKIDAMVAAAGGETYADQKAVDAEAAERGAGDKGNPKHKGV